MQMCETAGARVPCLQSLLGNVAASDILTASLPLLALSAASARSSGGKTILLRCDFGVGFACLLSARRVKKRM